MDAPICGLPYLSPSGWYACPITPLHRGPHGHWVAVDGQLVRFCADCRQVLECLCGREQWTTE